MSTGRATNSPAASEPASNEDLTLSLVVVKAPSSSPKKGSLKRKYGGLREDDLCGKRVRKELQKVVVSKLRFDDNLLHGHMRTRDPKVVQLRREDPEANPPTRPSTIQCCLDVGVYAIMTRARSALQCTFVFH